MQLTLAEKPWRHITLPQDVETNQSVLQGLRVSAENHPSHPALILQGKIVTYQALDTLTTYVANALYAVGFQQGQRAIVMMQNCPQAVIATLGILKAGGVVVPLDPNLSTDALDAAIHAVSAETIFLLSNRYHQFKQVQPKSGIRRVIVAELKMSMPRVFKKAFELFEETQAGHKAYRADADIDFQDLLKLGKKAPVPNVTITGETTATFLPESGQTVTHEQLVTEIAQLQQWQIAWQPAREVVLSALPYSDELGALLGLHVGIASANTLVFLSKWQDPAALVRAAATYRATVVLGSDRTVDAIRRDSKTAALASVRLALADSGKQYLKHVA